MVERLDPVSYSIEENKFLLAHVGEPPLLAKQAITPGINQAAVMPLIDTIYQYEEMSKRTGFVWEGIEKVKAAISTYLREAEKWALDRRRNRPRFPSMSTFDGKGRPHFQGPGADAGRVKTYFDRDGSRKPFALDLIPDNVIDWAPELYGQADEPTTKGIKVNKEDNRIECHVNHCGFTSSFNPDSRGSFNMARARMSKHLRTAKKDPDEHREVHTLEFA